MNIGDTSDAHLAVSTAHPSKTGAGAETRRGAASAASSGVGVPVTLTAQARALGQSSAADIDLDKVQAAKQALANGTFSANPEAIADRLIANAQEMLNHVRH